jgi:hypothetical protein
MRPRSWSIGIASALAIAGGACNQQVNVIDSPVAPTAVPSIAVASVRLSTGAVTAGGSLQGTVMLTGPAASSGMNVSLEASDDAASVDPALTIPAGRNAADFTIATRAVASDRRVQITASAAGRSATGAFEVWADAPMFFTYVSEPGDFVGGGRLGHFTPGTATFTASCDRNMVSIRVVPPGAALTWFLSFSGPAGVPLRAGTYEGATRDPFNRETPGLSVSGESRGCNMLGGRFVIHDIDLQNNRVNRFHASYVQRCDNQPGLLSGDVRVANMPPSSSVGVGCQR